MSVAPVLPVLSNPLPEMWPITLIVIVVVVCVPPAMVNPTLSTVITLLALLLGKRASRVSGRLPKVGPQACPSRG